MSPAQDGGLEVVELLAAAVRTAAGAEAVVRPDDGPVLVGGLRGGLAGFVLSHLVAELGKDWQKGAPALVVVTPTESRARQLAQELRFFLGPHPDSDPALSVPWATVLPRLDVSPYVDLAPEPALVQERLSALFRLAHGFTGPVLAVGAEALLLRVMDRAAFDRMCDLVGPGLVISRDTFTELLHGAGYRRMPLVEDPGCFAVRGGIVDVYPPVARRPFRVEMDGDVVVSVRLFDPRSQRTIRSADQLFIHPVRETIKTEGARPREKLLKAAEACGCPSSKVRSILEYVDEGVDFFGAESLAPVFHGTMDPVEAYLPESAVWMVEDRSEVLDVLTRAGEDRRNEYQNRLELNRLALEPEELFVDPERLADRLNSRCAVEWRTGGEPAGPHAAMRVRSEDHFLIGSEVRKAAGLKGAEILGPLARHIRRWQDECLRVVLASPDLKSARRLTSLLAGYGLQPELDSERDPETGLGRSVLGEGAGEGSSLSVRAGRVSGGFTWSEGGFVLVSEEELFGTRKRAVRRAPSTLPVLEDLSQLGEGDNVVHEVHGVGRYGGLTRQVVGGVPADFLLIEYAGTDRLYLPVQRFDLVRRYVGAGRDHKVPLDRLGGVTFERRRRKVSDEVRKMAEQLLQLTAARQSLPGHAFPDGGEVLAAFEATFPFEETPDQAVAIEAVLSDMQSDGPMDRLVCGDVGYGKTEVALRASVLAALDSRQVAVLAPTTVLTEQHLATFRDRLRSFPVSVAGLSRFRSKAAQERVLADLASGKLDVVVGTHRLLSADVRFTDLGLVIIDEEQRFGVGHKERLKELRTQVDVLSLTATPIPRTLRMALTGLRELSIIATAPVDRQAVRTYVCEYSPLTVVQAVRQELARNGQVFFVVPTIGPTRQGASRSRAATGSRAKSRTRSGADLGISRRRKARAGPRAAPRATRAAERPGAGPRVGDGAEEIQSIEWWSGKLKELVPEATTAIAHGQMDARKLERVMVEFVEGRHQVLVCTSLVESGLDIPKANTMLVMHADRFGLSQLYQLRGRVGRSQQRAFCYYMVESVEGLSRPARKRLAALERFSDLGSAFHLAVEDLEIRGAGDVLGKKQSGQVASVGFDTYMRLMEEAVAVLKGEPVSPERDCDLRHDLPAYLPDHWISDPARRLYYYQRLARAADKGEIDDIISEMTDIYGGPLPSEVTTLGRLTGLKLDAKKTGATAVEISGSRLVLTMEDEPPLEPDRLLKLAASNRRIKLTPQGQIVFRFKREGPEDNQAEKLEEAKKVLQELLACANPTG